jgi:hydroxymethylbilane synthase
MYRGNVDTRLRKLEEGVADATLLAFAGLKRLGLEDRVTALIDTEEMLPAVAQGAIGVETREGDARMGDLLASLNHSDTATCVAAERAYLAVLDGSCRTPIAGLAELDGKGGIRFRGAILSPDGRQYHETERRGAATDAVALGEDAARELVGVAGPDFFQAAS